MTIIGLLPKMNHELYFVFLKKILDFFLPYFSVEAAQIASVRYIPFASQSNKHRQNQKHAPKIASFVCYSSLLK